MYNAINKYVKNGLYIPLLCYYYYYHSGDYLLPIYICLKAFSFNYYLNFSYLYPNPNITKWKHLIRLTDTGHYANFLFYFYPKMFISISHNILFIITFAYFICTYALNMKDSDQIYNKDIIVMAHDIHCFINHLLPYFIIVYHLKTTKNDICEFDDYSLIYSYLWIYTWCFFIYIPWFYFTKDPVYSVMSFSVPLKNRIFVVILVNLLLYFSNQFGRYISC